MRRTSRAPLCTLFFRRTGVPTIVGRQTGLLPEAIEQTRQRGRPEHVYVNASEDAATGPRDSFSFVRKKTLHCMFYGEDHHQQRVSPTRSTYEIEPQSVLRKDYVKQCSQFGSLGCAPRTVWQWIEVNKMLLLYRGPHLPGRYPWIASTDRYGDLTDA